MRRVLVGSLVALAGAVVFSSVMLAQTAEPSAAAKSGSSAPFDPHDISGVWYRTSPIQTFSAVPNVQPGLPRTIEGGRGRGANLVEAPFTPPGRLPTTRTSLDTARALLHPRSETTPWVPAIRSAFPVN